MTSEASPNAISSPAPGSGPSQPDLLAGLTPAPSGPPPVRASRTARQAKDSEPMIQGICGRTYIGSSVPPAAQDTDLLSSWENKLRARLATVGSTECALIWREKKSPLGLSISRLARSTRHTNETGSGGSLWPTPKAAAAGPDFAKMERSDTGLSLQTVMAGTSYWPTPKASAAGESSRSGDRKDEPLMGSLMRMAHWPTVTADVSGDTPEAHEARQARVKERHGRRMGTPLNVAMIHAAEGTTIPALVAHWSTPRASDGEKGGAPKQEFSAGGQPLPAQIYANNNTDLTVPGGPTPSGSSATTAKRGAPNPAFPCWLMGWSDELLSGVLRAIQSYRSSRPRSSRRSLTPKPA